MTWLTVREGHSPLLVSLPHTGTDIPQEIAAALVSLPLARTDTDWWIDRLYDFAEDLDATIVRTSISRTVVDVNRDPSGASLYPGQATTGLCPLTTFAGEPLYKPGREPDAEEVAARRKAYFDPYHAALATQIARLRLRHPTVVLYDCHSIRSVIPRLFEGELPVFNIGTDRGRSCDPRVQEIVETACMQSGFSTVANGRFTGGWITRSLADPAGGVHAVQMELACRAYMEESPDPEPAPYSPARAAQVRETLRPLLADLRDWARGAVRGESGVRSSARE